MSSLVCPVRGKKTLPGLLTGTWSPATSTMVFASAMASALSQEVRETVADRLLKLLVRARVRRAVRAPANELRRVPEAGSFHVVVADLDDAFWAQRNE